MTFILARKITRKSVLTLLCFILAFSGFSLLSRLFSSIEKSSVRLKEGRTTHALCVIVPFRDRFEELLEFIPHITLIFERQKIKHHIFVMNQIDSYRFNRGALINAGFQLSATNTDCDYIAMHDVDLLPLNENISYKYPDNHVFHIASPSLHPRYHYKTFIGGILLINRQLYVAVDGLSNRYWGWGMEDDEFYQRLKSKHINILRPISLSTDSTNTFKHIHGTKRKRDQARCFNQTRVNRKRDRITGLHNVEFQVENIYKLKVNESPLTVINVKLNCNLSSTPWCSCDPA